MEWTTIIILVVIVGMMVCSLPFALSLAKCLQTTADLLKTLGDAAAGIINLIDGAIQKVLDSCQQPGVFTACHIFSGMGILGFLAWFLGKTVPLFKRNTPEPPTDSVSARLAAIESAINSRPLEEVRRTQARDQIAQTETFTQEYEASRSPDKPPLTPQERATVNEMGALVTVTKAAQNLIEASKGMPQQEQAQDAYKTSRADTLARAKDIEIEMQDLSDKVQKELGPEFE